MLDKEFYKKVNKDGLVCEVIYVSDDRTEDDYNYGLLNDCVKTNEE